MNFNLYGTACLPLSRDSIRASIKHGRHVLVEWWLTSELKVDSTVQSVFSARVYYSHAIVSSWLLNVLFNKISQRDLDRLQRLQNKCARFVSMPPRHTNISPVLKNLHWLRIKDRISFKTLHYVYKSLNGLCPRYIILMHAFLLEDH